MTNQQAPEALRLAAEVLDWMPTSDTQRALWDRHQKALVVVKAALVEAQQPAAHVQNPGEIEHVAGDVSKNGPESNMAQQPAPSAAAFDEHGFRDWVLRNLPKGSIIGNGEWWADHLTALAKRFVKAAPQPSPTPQADSSQDEPLQAFDSPRAKALMRAWEEGWAACRDAEYVGEEAQNDAFNSSHTLTLCIAEDQQLPAPQADSAIASHGQAPAQPGVQWQCGPQASGFTAPQADSQPAPQGETNAQLDTDSNSPTPGQQRDVAGPVAVGQPVGHGSDSTAGDPSAQRNKLLTVAERNIRSFLRSAVFKSESDREAALNCVDVLWEAASAPADSVTAPAGWAALQADLVAECERAMRQRDKYLKTGVSTASHGGSHDTCFPAILRKHGITAKAADSVLEDAARWQALESCVLEINGGDDWMSIVLKDDAKPEDFLKRLLASKLTALAARKQGANHDQ